MLNFIKRTVPFVAVFILSGFVIGFMMAATDYSCLALEIYWGEDFFETMGALIVKGAIFLGGIVGYLIIRNFIEHNRLRFKYIYWSVLPLVILSPAIYQHVRNWEHRAMDSAICLKSTNDGSMRAKSIGLNMFEYAYFQKNMKVFTPDLPSSAKNIDVSFYGDDFLGDFSLNITFTCSLKEKITKDDNWGVTSIDKVHAIQKVYYSSNRQ